MEIRAVLTGDIVNSTKLTPVEEGHLLQLLGQLFKGHLSEFFRGDSFQVYVKEPEGALKLALLCRAAARSLSKDRKVAVSDIRISIGIGKIDFPVRTLKNAKGEAFLLSGHQFDEIIKSKKCLDITTTQPLANEGLKVISDYINSIFGGMTQKQAQVIFLLLKGQNQQEVADKLKKTKSTIHQLQAAGNWGGIEKLLKQFENIINLIK